MADQNNPQNQKNDQVQNDDMNMNQEGQDRTPEAQQPEVPAGDPSVMAPPGEAISEKTVSGAVDLTEGVDKKEQPQGQVSSTGGSGQVASGEVKQPVSPASADYSKFVKSNRSKYALWVIIVGTVLLVASGIGYYLAVYGFELPGSFQIQSDPVVEEPVAEPGSVQEPEVEEPTITGSETGIEDDEQIMMFEELESNPASSLSQMENELESVDYEGIDTNLQESEF